MDSRSRMETAFAFQEPDRVPIELTIDPRAHALSEQITHFVETGADNFRVCGGFDWGFFGLPFHYHEEIIDDLPGEYRRIRRTCETPVGPFVAITKHNYPHLDSPDYHWERRYIQTFEDMVRLTDAPRDVRAFDPMQWEQDCAALGTRGMPCLVLMHPLGWLVRQACMEEVYGWLLQEQDTMHRFLDAATTQIIRTLDEVGRQARIPWFHVTAHEMLIPPWMGMRGFNEWVFPYDKAVNDTVHRIGGKLRAHCHGNCMHFLERMSEMGIDAIEPLEPAPFGDVDLREAKQRVGSRMVLSGNIPSQDFVHLRPDEVRQLVKETIAIAAPGGGFSLRTTGGWANVDADLDTETLAHVIANVKAYIDAGLEYGQYPIRT